MHTVRSDNIGIMSYLLNLDPEAGKVDIDRTGQKGYSALLD